MPGIFGDMCDFNEDGRLDSVEQAMEFVILDEMTRSSKSSDDWDCGSTDPDFSDDWDCGGSDWD